MCSTGRGEFDYDSPTARFSIDITAVQASKNLTNEQFKNFDLINNASGGPRRQKFFILFGRVHNFPISITKSAALV